MTARWYMVNAIGMATLCSDEADARLEAVNADQLYPRHAPHRAVQMVELSSLRDQFAGQALAGMLADLPKSCYGFKWQENVAREAYTLADAMLKARAEGGAS